MKHLAVFDKDTLEAILSKKKTIESRFAKVKFPPFKKVKKGDEVFMKVSGGKIIGKFKAGNLFYFDNLDRKKVKDLKERYGEEVAVSDKFWQEKEKAKYATFIEIKNPEKLRAPIAIDKHDQRSWILLDDVPGANLSQLAIQFSDKDSLNNLMKLLETMGEKQGWIPRSKDPKDMVLRLNADASKLAGHAAGSKKVKGTAGFKDEIVETLIDILVLARHFNIDLYKETSNKIKKEERKVGIDKL